MALFEVAILERPAKKDGEEPGPERLVFGPKAVVAKDAQAAAIAAVLSEAKALEMDINRIEVKVRPF